jgi:hypothetical protein
MVSLAIEIILIKIKHAESDKEKNELDHGGKKFENPEEGAKNGEISSLGR